MAATADAWPQRCCGREFQSQRALDGHRQSHKRCDSCGFEGNPRALGDHRCGDAAAAPRVIGTTTEYLRADGSPFTVVDEPDVPPVALEDEYPARACGRRRLATKLPSRRRRPTSQRPSCRPSAASCSYLARPVPARVACCCARRAGRHDAAAAARWARDEAVVSQLGDDRRRKLRWLTARARIRCRSGASRTTRCVDGRGKRCTARRLQAHAVARRSSSTTFVSTLTLAAACCAAAPARHPVPKRLHDAHCWLRRTRASPVGCSQIS